MLGFVSVVLVLLISNMIETISAVSSHSRNNNTKSPFSCLRRSGVESLSKKFLFSLVFLVLHLKFMMKRFRRFRHWKIPRQCRYLFKVVCMRERRSSNFVELDFAVLFRATRPTIFVERRAFISFTRAISSSFVLLMSSSF